MRTKRMTRIMALTKPQTMPMAPAHKRALYALLTFLLLAAVAYLTAPFPRASAASSEAKAAATKKAPAKQKAFASAQEGMEAVAAALKAHDVATLKAILGVQGDAILESGDPMEDKATRERFTAAYAESHKVEERTPGTAWIVVGKDDWPLPIPLVKRAEGWVFDTKAGKEELLNRRIGRNELSAIQAVLAYVDAQQEYYQRNPQKEKLFQYAQKFVSSPGKRDGLYFQTKAGEKPSPLGPLFDVRRAAGYVDDTGGKPGPYHGYYYKILKGQGAKAEGGAYDYVVQGKMLGGFALVAYPAKYGNSGVMTFIVNHDGVVYEKNLGPKTSEIAQKMTRFNPDETWKRR